MKRRDFLRMGSFMTVSVAALGITACGSSDDNTDDGSIAPNPVRPDAPVPPAGGTFNFKFPQSVATGDPRPDSVVFWTRVIHDPLGDTDNASVDVPLQLRVTEANNSTNLGTTTLTGTPIADVKVSAYVDFDGTVRHKMTGLSANKVYYYQFVVLDSTGAEIAKSKIGRTKTAPAASSTADVKFAFMSCQDWDANHWGAFTQIVADDGAGSTPSLDFIVHLGDYIYETSHVTPSGESRHGHLTLPSGAAAATTTNDYRYLYKSYRGDDRLQALHERFPVIAIWDDHEFSDDCWQSSATYDNANTPDKPRRRSANQAWFEYTPADVAFSENDPGFQNIKIYRDLKFGKVVHLVMTDERLYRADHMIPETTAKPGTTGATTADQLGRINSRYLAPEASYKMVEAIKTHGWPDPLQTVSILGATQRQWWKDTMARSTATWKIWGNEVSLLRMGLHGTNALGNLIPLGIFGALTDPVAATGIAAIPAQVNAAVAPLLVPASLGLPGTATPPWVAVIVGLTPAVGNLLATNHSVPPASAGAAAQGLLAQTAGYIAAQAAAGDAAMLTAAKASLMAGVAALSIPGLSSGEADSVAPSALGIFKRALAIGNMPIATAVTGAVGAGASAGVAVSQTDAATAAYAITAKSADPSATPTDLAAAAIAAGLAAGSAAQSAIAQAAVGGFLNAIGVGNLTIAAAVAGAATAGADTTIAAQAAFAITATDANPSAVTAHRVGAAQQAGLTAVQADAAVAAYEAAKAALPSGAAAQIPAAANQIAFAKAKPDILANKTASPFYLKATGASAAAVGAFFQKFLLNADQWDGYQKERKELMNHLLGRNIKNVVAITGDIHSFWAGQVYNDFPGEVTEYATTAAGSAYETAASPGGQVAMVDLVTAGISSTSWFEYIKEAVDVLDPTNALIGKLVYVPVAVNIDAGNPLGLPAMSFTLPLNILDYSMGKPAPADEAELSLQLINPLKRALAANGVPEASLTLAANGIAGQIALAPTFKGALALAQTAATSIAANPWLKHVDSDAQGYAVVTAKAGQLQCEFRKLNPQVGTVAPTTVVTSTKTLTLTKDSTTIA